MKKYTRPEIEVTAYEVENVVTTGVSAYFANGVGENGEEIGAVATVDYTDIFGA